MIKISENTIGFDAEYVHSVDFKIKSAPFGVGTRVRANDGTYTWARASEAIAANATDATVTDEGVASAGAGSSENASGVALVTGDQAWFKMYP